MYKFILKRIGYMCFTIVIIITLTFMLMHVIPGDPLGEAAMKMSPEARANFYAKYNLDKPVLTQYTIYLKNIVTKGDFGDSMVYPGRSISKIIKETIPVSAYIGVQSLVFGVVLGLVLGIIAAFNRAKTPDYIVMFIALVFVSIPSFVFAGLLQYAFAGGWLKILPTTGWGQYKHTILPAIAGSFGYVAGYARYMRASCLDVIGQDYIQTAKAKGVPKMSLIWKHILKNAFLPIVTMLGLSVAFMITGSFVIETIFSVPGTGRYFVSAVSNRDYTMIMGITIFDAILYVVALLVIDILYTFIDPRIKIN